MVVIFKNYKIMEKKIDNIPWSDHDKF